MRRFAALALPVLFAASLAACDYDGEPHHPGDPAVPRLSVRTAPSTTPQPGDTLTFYALFPDSTSERYLIAWYLDERGRELLGGCTRGDCAKWIVPPGSGRYNHSIQVNGDQGVSGIPLHHRRAVTERPTDVYALNALRNPLPRTRGRCPEGTEGARSEQVHQLDVAEVA